MVQAARPKPPNMIKPTLTEGKTKSLIKCKGQERSRRPILPPAAPSPAHHTRLTVPPKTLRYRVEDGWLMATSDRGTPGLSEWHSVCQLDGIQQACLAELLNTLGLSYPRP